MGNFKAGIFVLVLFICCLVPSFATVYTVGDSAGWAIGVDYTTWATGKTFNVGDSLVFNYPSGHTVDEVSASDYQSCTAGNAITSDQSGATTIPLKTAGTHYFTCGVMGHCSGGMKLAVTVAAASGGGGGSTTPSSGTTSPSSGTTTPSSATPTPDTTTTTTTTGTTSHPSASVTLSPFIPLLISGVAAIFYFFIIS
ncbi:PREDICTED: blue copper protein-like [Nicotiana attenuata]|uniref:Blue copper protein n=1 Tax=Nicotiana attenuata TaxID=49451 RepID=A0A314L503_NICAT|nr:PREDICTED: blue copper protein-like [Nicotiana attenuata]OIT36676.1 blue copper protein [Nicotiana attenuata]